MSRLLSVLGDDKRNSTLEQIKARDARRKSRNSLMVAPDLQKKRRKSSSKSRKSLSVSDNDKKIRSSSNSRNSLLVQEVESENSGKRRSLSPMALEQRRRKSSILAGPGVGLGNTGSSSRKHSVNKSKEKKGKRKSKSKENNTTKTDEKKDASKKEGKVDEKKKDDTKNSDDKKKQTHLSVAPTPQPRKRGSIFKAKHLLDPGIQGSRRPSIQELLSSGDGGRQATWLAGTPDALHTPDHVKREDLAREENEKKRREKYISQINRADYENDEDYLEARLHELIEQHEISYAQAGELRFLRNYDIVFLCDDSGSMRAKLKQPLLGTEGERIFTRWEELRSTVEMVLEIALCFDEDGIDLYFLNRPPIRGLHSFQDPRLREAFEGKPKGHTPLASALRASLQEQTGDERPILLLISTDGRPTDDCGDEDLENFRRYLTKAVSKGFVRRRVCVSFLCCTDNDKDIDWLNMLDKEVKHVDVSDDYLSEKKEVMSNPANGIKSFNRADYVIKALLGPTSAKYDDMDFVDDESKQKQVLEAHKKEEQLRAREQEGYGESDKSCCTIQ